MEERGIIIADRDAAYRKEMADFFETSGYCVETTDSAVHVLCSILEKRTPVLLLGNDFDKKVATADLIHLLKKCNRNLNVIIVSDDMPLAQARRVREEGIFYHALKPATSGDTEEIGMAVECAFQKQTDAGASFQPALHREPVISDAEPELVAVPKAAAPRALVKEAPWVTILIVLIFGTSYLSLFATDTGQDGSRIGIWLFLGFCAFIIATQLLPIFLINPPATKESETQERDPFDR
jgi:DNA-binding NarL/FixJ family response regulator